ncbi:MAG: hypothetical protein U0U70_04990 [Chitinophagaceae bacterium]
MKNVFITLTGLVLLSGGWLSCHPAGSGGDTNPPGPYTLSYGDSIIYLRPSTGDYIVNPTSRRDGVYTGFPDGIEIDASTGAINVSKSETGLRYRITHTAPDGKKTETTVVLSGITFKDRFYILSQSDSLALPVYNASEIRVLPLSGSSFDEGNNANSGGCSVRTDNGIINLAQCVRNGVFGNTPQNDSRRDFDIAYRINDGSGKSLNKLRVRIYYYTSMADVAPDLLQTLSDRQSAGVFLRGSSAEAVQQTAKPRPPCVIIVDH